MVQRKNRAELRPPEAPVQSPSAPVFSLPLKQALRASDDLLDIIPVAASIYDSAGRIVRYNRRAVELWGRAPTAGELIEEFTAQARFFDADGRELPCCMVAEVLKHGRPVRDEELIVERPNGERVTVLLNVDPLVDMEGNLVGVIACYQDITERKRAIEELHRSRQDLRQQQQRWNATYEHAAIGIVETDAEGRFLRVNEAICAIAGASREELLGWQLFPRTHPDDRELDEDLYRRQVAGDLGFYSLEKRVLRKDGGMLWVAVRSSTVRNADGRFLYGVRVVQDISERKEAEERQKLLMDELNHRVKNTLATVQSLAAQTAQAVDGPDEFLKAFEGRLVALSQAHDQLTRRHWKSADLHDIVIGATAPYLARSRDRVKIKGDSIRVQPRVALTLALALHELTTNAAKYGALSVSSGRIAVRWRVLRLPSQPQRLRLEWRERGGPPVAAPRRFGFGSRFIEGSVAAELQGVARLDFDPAGLCCTMEFPLKSTMLDFELDSA